MKFKINSKVVCVDINISYHKTDYYSVSYLNLYDIYTIESYDSFGNIILSEMLGYYYDPSRFITTNTHRKLKLKEIENVKNW